MIPNSFRGVSKATCLNVRAKDGGKEKAVLFSSPLPWSLALNHLITSHSLFVLLSSQPNCKKESPGRGGGGGRRGDLLGQVDTKKGSYFLLIFY